MLSSSGTSPAVNGSNNFSSLNHRSNSGSGPFFPSRSTSNSQFPAMNSSGQESTSPVGSTPIGHFHIGTFNAGSTFNDESGKGPTAVHQNSTLSVNNSNREGSNNSPNNLGSRETGIIEKLLVNRNDEKTERKTK